MNVLLETIKLRFCEPFLFLVEEEYNLRCYRNYDFGYVGKMS